MNHSHGLAHSFAEPVFWIAAALCVIAELALLRSAFLPRALHHDSPAGPHTAKGTEMIWAVVPAIALAVLLAYTWRAVNH